MSSDVELVKCFTQARFPIFLILPEKTSTKNIENGGHFTHIFGKIVSFLLKYKLTPVFC